MLRLSRQQHFSKYLSARWRGIYRIYRVYCLYRGHRSYCAVDSKGRQNNSRRGIGLSSYDLRKGVTLAELAIVILLMALLFSIVFAVMSGLIQITSFTTPRGEARKQTFFALQILRTTIEQTYFHPQIKRLWFVGRTEGDEENQRSSLTFSAIHSGAEEIGAAAVREVSYYLKENEEGIYTMLRREDALVDDEPGKGGAHYPVLEKVLSLAILYSNNGEDWEDEWDSRKNRRIPRYVRIQLKVEVEGREEIFEALAVPGIQGYRG